MTKSGLDDVSGRDGGIRRHLTLKVGGGTSNLWFVETRPAIRSRGNMQCGKYGGTHLPLNQGLNVEGATLRQLCFSSIL